MRSRRPFAKSISTMTAASDDGALTAGKTLTGKNAGTALLVLASTSLRRTRIQNFSVLSTRPFFAAYSSGLRPLSRRLRTSLSHAPRGRRFRFDDGAAKLPFFTSPWEDQEGGFQILLLWNCKHIAAAMLRGRLEAICRAAGYEPPVICTPLELVEE
jgi:hypothetical protein